jgi:hypothetical protein
MKFPFRDFWSRLIVKFGDFTYLQSELTFNLDDYGKKESVTFRLTGEGGSLA